MNYFLFYVLYSIFIASLKLLVFILCDTFMYFILFYYIWSFSVNTEHQHSIMKTTEIFGTE